VAGITHAMSKIADLLLIENVLEKKLPFHKLDGLLHNGWCNLFCWLWVYA
jgi:hypothetical protein